MTMKAILANGVLIRVPIALLIGIAVTLAHAAGPIRWEKRVLTDRYYCDGINCGDFNRDGQTDIVAGPFWYQGPEFNTKHEIYPPKEFPKPPSPTDSLYSVYDIITSLDAHGWGLAWFEQVKDGGKITFREHIIMGDRAEELKYGVAFSQPHALASLGHGRKAPVATTCSSLFSAPSFLK